MDVSERALRSNSPGVKLFRHALAVGAVGIAAVGTHLLKGAGDSGVSPLFFAAVLISAWYGGLSPGLLATILSGVATAYLLTSPQAISFSAVGNHILRLMVFIVVSVLTSSLHGAMRRAAEESHKARKAAESASAAKSQFLAMVSHELRTPLSPVLMAAEMLEHDPALPPHMLRDIRTIRRHVDLEIRLIEDLVDLTRINTGKLQLQETLVDLRMPLEAAIQVCAYDIHEKQLELKIHWTSVPGYIVGDAFRLQQIFWNLLRNAIKFTARGGQISVTSRNMEDARISVEIRDSGIGIDPQQLSRIFVAFEQGEPDIQARFGGLGLGLAICQALVEAHHGHITAGSLGRGHGATFTVILPLAAQSAVQAVGQSERAAEGSGDAGYVMNSSA